MRISFLIGAIVLAVAIIVGLQYQETIAGRFSDPVADMPGDQAEPGAKSDQVSDTADAEIPDDVVVIDPPAVAAAPPLPELSASDAFLREAITDWPGNELIPQAWLELENYIDRLTTLIANVADGTLPRRALGMLAPQGKFEVNGEAGALTLDPSGYQRYDTMVSSLTALPATDVAALLKRIEPWLNQTLVGLGEPRPVATLLGAAFDRVLAVDLIQSPIALEPKGALYAFADPALENLPEFEKQLLRMGPDNIERLQAFTRAVRSDWEAM